jgi:hypothetical protein
MTLNSTRNAIGSGNLIVGYILFRVGKVSSEDGSALAIFFAGIVVISTLLSLRFAMKQAK